ncbi:serine/threonine protein kinase-like protein [Phanerochaete sordida]|uniref:non-specific serine/threonine protein kinase n=1 Tax=Phanerochaete sordida TaxID=48140 RepID=A0A9P3G2I1_9APHY|nr:serine/threonine protein kinase-like protein [Phanerochaete sordida]
MPDFTGRVIQNGRYQLKKLLGSGTYGVVYGAIDLTTRYSPVSHSPRTPRRYAIKVLRKDTLSSSAAQRVRREVAAHRRMTDHPNVVTLHDSFEDKEFVYIVLNFCPGGDLFGKIVDEKRFFRNDAATKSVFLQILDAVEACHAREIYHRDLKPENILSSEDGTEVYLSDFGLASGSKVGTTFGCGSSFYMSPECIGREVGYMPYSNVANDVWALGVILVNMISSRTPWTKALSSDDCFMDFLMNENYLREMLPISEGANTLFRRVFAYDPEQRMTLPELRQAVAELDTFFMSDVEIARGPDAVRATAAHCGLRVRKAKGAVEQAQPATRPRVAAPAPPRTPAMAIGPMPAPEQTSVRPFEGGDLSEASVASDASLASVESAGPATPNDSAQGAVAQLSELDITLTTSGSSFWRKAIEKVTPRGLGLGGSVKVQA